MGEKKEWLKSEIDQLINMYQNKPELWDVKCKVYKDRVNKRDALSEIAEKFETTMEEITRKIHNLRNQLNSELKKTAKKKSGQSTDELYISKWPYFKSLLFLQGGLICRVPVGNIATIAFSSLYEERCPFTRDYNIIKAELQNVDDYDKTCIESALHGVSHMVLGEWGNNTACQVILITDGSTGIGPMSLKDSLSSLNRRTANNPFPLPFAFPAKLHIVCIAQPNDQSLIKSKPLYQRLIDLSGYSGSLSICEAPLNEQSAIDVFQRLAEDMYTSFKGTLKCGNLESKIILYPAPVPCTKVTDFETQTHTISELIEVCGFISVNDVGSPMAVSRHLILPATSCNKENIPIKTEPDATDDDLADEGKTPSFCVLLHGALKVENMAALVTLGDDWFGFVYSWADSKKKSNLMLTVLTVGSDAVPWLGDLNHLTTADMTIAEQLTTFPVRPPEKRSYSQNGVVWIRQAGLQSDIQKILRHARKLPEKTQQFYKELNRLRKAAISLGFLDLLTGLAYIFDQECMQLPGSAHPDCALQLQHAADVLRKTQNRDIKFMIVPLQTNYNSS